MRAHEPNPQCPICLESFAGDDGTGTDGGPALFDCGHRACLSCATTCLQSLLAEQAAAANAPPPAADVRRPWLSAQFPSGAMVTTHGLQTTEYNGQHGRVRPPALSLLQPVLFIRQTPPHPSPSRFLSTVPFERPAGAAGFPPRRRATEARDVGARAAAGRFARFRVCARACALALVCVCVMYDVWCVMCVCVMCGVCGV